MEKLTLEIINTGNKKYTCSVHTMHNSELVEFEGNISYCSHRKMYEFEPTFFTSPTAEEFYDSNWEVVEEEILNVLYNKKR